MHSLPGAQLGGVGQRVQELDSEFPDFFIVQVTHPREHLGQREQKRPGAAVLLIRARNSRDAVVRQQAETP
ncbi:hypothetical protein [Streptomyces sp. NPDC012510]|uniref:hypothetical protein n=1 Tax=Streptomyces sp. NPDC012510 TaxID=3364838 RepID=UPI0036E65F89